MNCIILGDKYQKRTKSKGCVGLIKTGNKPMVEHQYQTLKQIFPQAQIIYVYGFDGKRFSSFVNKHISQYNDMHLVYNSAYESKNSAYSLSLASQYLNSDCLIIFGDHIVHKKIFAQFRTSSDSQAFISKKHKNKLGCIINHNHIENISYDLDNCLTDMYYISKQHANIINQSLQDPSTHNCFIFELINKLIDQQQIITPTYTEYYSSPLLLNK